MKIKFNKEARSGLIELAQSKSIYIEGNILKLLEEGDDDFKKYIETAIEKDSEQRKKRLEVTRQVQEQNRDLELKANLLEKNTDELQQKAKENEQLMEELKKTLEIAEKAKEQALSDLDVVQKKSQFELIESIVSYALVVIAGTGIVTTALYTMAIMFGSPETTLIGNTWSNLLGILLTNSFSIIGTIMGVKYANKEETTKE